MFRLDGKTALVTGGAGIVGKQIVRAVAEAGAHTFVASRNVASLETLAADFAAEGLTIHPRALDQGDEASILTLRDSILAERDSVDVLVNNAGLALGTAKVQEADLSEWETMIDTNVIVML